MTEKDNPKEGGETREDRLAKALRENLKKRKSQSRDRAQKQPESPESKEP